MINYIMKKAEIQRKSLWRVQKPAAMRILCVTLFISLLTLSASTSVIAQKATIIDKNGTTLDVTLEEIGRSVHEDDSLALVAIYEALDGPNWVNNSGWLQDMVEHWHGIDQVREINPDEWRVTRLEIRSQNAIGTIPDDIQNMIYLDRLRLDGNLINGPFPVAVTTIPTLQRIEFQRNEMVGEVPWAEMAAMPDLRRLNLHSNNFEGEIPGDLEGYQRLEHIEIYSNRFTGQMPPWLGNLPRLTMLRLRTSQFTGDIPEEWGNSESLEIIDIRRNYQLTPGPLPSWILNLKETLQRLKISGTNRTGDIPSWLSELYKMERLYLGEGDEMGGELPDLTFMDNLEYIVFRDAPNITGEFPSWFITMPQLERIEIDNVGWTGSLPSNFGDGPFKLLHLENLNLDGPLPDLRNLDLERLYIENIGFDLGTFPVWLQFQERIEWIELPNNGISGTLPSWLGDLTNLVVINFSDNDLDGDISWAGDITELRSLRLNRTNIDLTEIPTWLMDKIFLRNLEIAGLGLTGEIPEWLAELPILAKFVADDNNLEGSIPAQFGNLALIDSFNVANNNLSGELPEALSSMGLEFGFVPYLTSFIVSGNENLSGSVPISFTNIDPVQMRVFWFDGTSLCEPDDAGFQDWLSKIESEITFYDQSGGTDYTSVRSTGVICGQETSSEIANGLPTRVHLYNNYPNPFNPSTYIKYDVPANMNVSLRVYNVLGQEIAQLVNEQKQPGRYEVSFDASKLSSGMYLYRLEAGDYVQTQTMILIK